MKRRVLALLLASLMTVSLIGCGDSDTASGTDDNAAAEDTGADEDAGDSAEEDVDNSSTDEDSGEAAATSGDLPDAGGATITLWMPPFGSEDTTDKEFWLSHLEDAAAAINAELVIETVPWDNYEEKYLTGVASGAGPDIGYMYNEMLYNYVDMGSLAVLDDYFTQEEIDNYIYWESGNIDGTQYTLPFVVGAPRILFCNMDLLNEAGYDAPPSTWAELEEIAEAITETTGKVGFQQYWGGYFGDLNETFFPYLWQAGGDIFDDAGNLILNNEEGVKAAEWLYSLKEKGIITESSTSMDASAVADEFRAGNVGMFVSSSTSATKTTEAGINWDYTPYISMTEDSEGHTTAVADCLVLLDSCENKEAAIYLMKEMTKASTMEEFHDELYSMPPISYDEDYRDDPAFEDMYENYADGFKTLPVAENTSQIYTTLFSNLQLMMMGELTPQEALDNTVDYAESLN